MARIKGAVNAKKKHKKILKLAKGFKGARSKQFKTANQFVMKALSHAYEGRKQKKRNNRSVWITRINAGVRAFDMNYSSFMHGLKLSNIDINRKMLSEMAIKDPEGFKSLVEISKKALS